MGQVAFIAHRGASTQVLENTLEAFNLAWDQGADGIEGDFRLTSDGKIVCFHDETTARVSDVNFDVSQITLKQLKELDAGKKYCTLNVPAISEVFSSVSEGKQIYIEVKTGVEILPELFLEIKQSKLISSQIKIISFDSEVIRRFKIQRPDIDAFLIVDFSSDKSMKKPREIIERLKEIKADGLSANYISVEEALIKNIIDAGFSMHLWTIDKIEEAKRFIDLGVSSITTNKPEVLKPLLN